MSYLTQKKIFGDFEEASNKRLKNVGVMANYDCEDFLAWSSNERERSNFVLNTLQTPGDSGDNIFHKLPFIYDETPPDEFYQQPGRVDSCTSTSSEANQQPIKEYVQKGVNTENLNDFDDLKSQITILQDEKKFLENELQSAHKTIQEYSNYFTEFEAQNYHLLERLKERDNEISQFNDMKLKLNMLEDLVDEAQKTEMQIEKDFEKSCQDLHIDLMLNHTSNTLNKLQTILVECDDDEIIDHKIQEHFTNKPENPESLDNSTVEYLNKLLCELQEISHASKECVYSYNQVKQDLFVKISEITSVRITKIKCVDQENQTEKDEISKKVQTCDDLMQSSEEIFENIPLLSLEDNNNLPESASSSNSMQNPEDPFQVSAFSEKPEDSNKSSETDRPERSSVDCQTVDRDPKTPTLTVFDNQPFYIGSLPRELRRQTEFDDVLETSVAELLRDIKEEKIAKIIQKQERLIDELNKELIIKDSELHEWKLKFSDIDEINKSFKKDFEIQDQENGLLTIMIRELKAKLQDEREKKPLLISTAAQTDPIRRDLRSNENTSGSISLEKSIAESIKESLQNIEESRIIGRAIRSSEDFQVSEKKSPLIRRDVPRKTLENLKVQKKIKSKSPPVSSKKNTPYGVIKSGKKPSPQKITKSPAIKSAVGQKQPIKEVIPAEGDYFPEDVNDHPTMKTIAWKIIKSGFSSLCSEDLNFLHCYIVTAELNNQTIRIKSREISCVSVKQDPRTSDDCNRIDDLLRRLNLCRGKATDLHEKLLYTTLERILISDE
ncbi:hypothetical protein DMENIID0001_102060 [Sergentomyia squamirostris]